MTYTVSMAVFIFSTWRMLFNMVHALFKFL